MKTENIIKNVTNMYNQAIKNISEETTKIQAKCKTKKEIKDLQEELKRKNNYLETIKDYIIGAVLYTAKDDSIQSLTSVKKIPFSTTYIPTLIPKFYIEDYIKIENDIENIKSQIETLKESN